MRITKSLIVGVLVGVLASMLGCSSPAPITPDQVVTADKVFSADSKARGSVSFALAAEGKASAFKIQAAERARVFADIKSVKIEFIRENTAGAPAVYTYSTNTVRDTLPYRFSGMAAPDSLYVRVTFYDQLGGLGRVINKGGVATISSNAFQVLDQKLTIVSMPVALLDGTAGNGDATVALTVSDGTETGPSFQGSDPDAAATPAPSGQPSAQVQAVLNGYGEPLNTQIDISSAVYSTAGSRIDFEVMFPMSWAGDSLKYEVLKNDGSVLWANSSLTYGGEVVFSRSHVGYLVPGTYWLVIHDYPHGYNVAPIVFQ